MLFFTSFFHSLAMFFIGILCLLSVPAQAIDYIEKQHEGDLAQLIYINESGDEIKFDTRKDKLTALHFWATWCLPCVEELPQVNATQKKYTGRGLNIIALSLDGKNTDRVKKFFEDNKIDFLEIFFSPDMMVLKSLGIKGLPTTIFVNQKGEEIARVTGKLDWNDKKAIDFIEDSLK